MDAEQRKAYLGALHSLRFDDLPDAALLFLGNYLMRPSADQKLGVVIEECQRLYGLSSIHLGDCAYEHVRYPGETDDETSETARP